MRNIQSAVLVVDDDPSCRAMLGLSLRQAGLHVHLAASGKDALRRLRRRAYAWLVTDAKMLPMDGFVLTQMAKSLRPTLRVIMLSAACSEQEASTCPIDKFFAKPAPIEQLIGVLKGGI